MRFITQESCSMHVGVVGYIPADSPILLHPKDSERMNACRRCGAMMLELPRPSPEAAELLGAQRDLGQWGLPENGSPTTLSRK
jgi:hypothetical protein